MYRAGHTCFDGSMRAGMEGWKFLVYLYQADFILGATTLTQNRTAKFHEWPRPGSWENQHLLLPTSAIVEHG